MPNLNKEIKKGMKKMGNKELGLKALKQLFKGGMPVLPKRKDADKKVRNR